MEGVEYLPVLSKEGHSELAEWLWQHALSHTESGEVVVYANIILDGMLTRLQAKIWVSRVGRPHVKSIVNLIYPYFQLDHFDVSLFELTRNIRLLSKNFKSHDN